MVELGESGKSDLSARLGGPETLEGLLAQTALGSRPAFEALYHQTSRRLFGICLRVLPHAAEAEDVLQEVFTTVWRKAGQFDSRRAGALAWLAMIARNKAIDRLRSLPRAGSTAPLEMADQIADPGASPQQRAHAQNDQARLENCLGQLDSRRRTLIHAAFFDGSTYEELAVRIGSPLGSVKSWIRRGLLQLRECLEQ